MKWILTLSFLIALHANAQIINTVAGNGIAGYSGDGASATSAELYNPQYCTFDDTGNMYISDFQTHMIRKVNTMGIISTYAGYYTTAFLAGGYSGDGGPATSARLNFPRGIAVDHSGNLYIADNTNYRIRKVTPSGIISTYAGTGVSGFSGDGGPATAAKFQNIWGIALDDTGNLYVADISSQRIRKINTAGIITTIAGSGTAGYSGDGGPATAAKLWSPMDVAVDHVGNIYIADELNNCIRKVNTSGIISTFAGNGIVGFTGDGGNATSAQMHWPTGVIVDNTSGPNAGYVYISDNGNSRVRQVSTSGIINTVAGTGPFGYNGDGILGVLAQLYAPMGLAVDASGSLHIADNGNNRIRNLRNGCVIAASPGSTVCTGTLVTYTIGLTPGCATPAYQWFVNGAMVGTGSSYTYTPSNGDSIRCIRTCSGGIPENSNTIHMVVSTSLVPSVSISASPTGTVCSGTFVTFTSTSSNAGSLPTYQWKVNGTTVGSSSTYTYAPSNGDSVRCILTSSLACATPAIVSSSTIIMSVISSSTLPTVTINAMPGSSVCNGAAVTFTATATSAGSTPFYQWKVNGINVGTGGTVFTYVPANGDIVTCNLSTSLPCITTGAVGSNTIIMTTSTVTVPTISISGPSSSLPGAIVSLTATVTGAGSSYVIKWMNYGVVFSTTTVPNTTYTKTTGIDVLTAKVMSTATGCYDTTTSGIILVEPTDATSIGNLHTGNISIYPNPVRQQLNISSDSRIESIVISNLIGQIVYNAESDSTIESINISHLPDGIYLAKINGLTVLRFIKASN